MAEVTVRQVWWAFVVAGVRSRVGVVLLVVGVGVCIWQLVSGYLTAGLVVLGMLVFTYGRIPAAIGASMARRGQG